MAVVVVQEHKDAVVVVGGEVVVVVLLEHKDAAVVVGDEVVVVGMLDDKDAVVVVGDEIVVVVGGGIAETQKRWLLCRTSLLGIGFDGLKRGWGI